MDKEWLSLSLMMEKTFVMLKPDAIQRCIIGKIVSRFEQKGLKIVAIKFIHVSKELAEKNYAMHKGKPFFHELMGHITSAPVVVMVLEGENTISVVRNIVGATDPKQALAGTIRGDFGLGMTKNIVHASDSKENAEREINTFFNKNELVEYKRIDEDWIYVNK